MTGQKYGQTVPSPNVAEATAGNSSQTVNQTNQTPPLDWRMAFLTDVMADREALDDLFNLLYLIWDAKDSIDPTPFISEVFSEWAGKEHKDLNKSRYEIRALISHIAWLHKIKQEYECFRNTSGYEDRYQRGYSPNHE